MYVHNEGDFTSAIAEGIAAGHTHAAVYERGVSDAPIKIEAARYRPHIYMVVTGYPVYHNFSKHTYEPVVVGVDEDAPAAGDTSYGRALARFMDD